MAGKRHEAIGAIAAAVVARFVGRPGLRDEARQVWELAARRAALPPRVVAVPRADILDGGRDRLVAVFEMTVLPNARRDGSATN